MIPAGKTYRVEVIDGLANGAVSRRPLSPADVVLAIARPDEHIDRSQQASFLALLSQDERRRMVRLHFERDRLLFLVAHALLRITLSRYSDVMPDAWQFGTAVHGRPEIANRPSSRLRFSLSHTSGLAACAVMLNRDLGVDVEHLSRKAAAGVADRVFTAREAGDLNNAPAETRAARFLEYWTLKEAYLKACGLGLSLPLDRFSVYQQAAGRWRMSFEPPLTDDPARWWLWSSRVGNSHQAALAVG